MFVLTHQIFQAISPAYPGPDTTLPLVSIIAGIIGVFLIFGRYIFGRVRLALRKLFRRGETESDATMTTASTPPDENA